MEDVKKVFESKRAMLVSTKNKGTVSGGKVVMKDGRLDAIIEGTHNANELPVSISTALYKLDHSFFKYPMIKIEGREEFGLPQTLVLYAKDYPVEIIEASGWKQVTAPEDLV